MQDHREVQAGLHAARPHEDLQQQPLEAALRLELLLVVHLAHLALVVPLAALFRGDHQEDLRAHHQEGHRGDHQEDLRAHHQEDLHEDRREGHQEDPRGDHHADHQELLAPVLLEARGLCSWWRRPAHPSPRSSGA